MPNRQSHRVLMFVATASVLIAGCGKTMARRVPGSDITLPERPEDQVARAVLSPCARGADTTAGLRGSSRLSCAVGDSARQPVVENPPQKIP